MYLAVADDRLILQGTVLTMDAMHPVAGALGIRDGQIAAVGSVQDVSGVVGDEAEMVGFDGAVLPGFIDAHHHLAAFDARAPDLHLAPGSSIADVLALVERAAARDGDHWLRLQGYDPAKLWRPDFLAESVRERAYR